jgi:DNA modification methylase
MNVNQIYLGDCIDIMASLPAGSVDLIFADPPYNLQLQGDLFRPNMTRVDAVTDEWDQFPSTEAYDIFTRRWLTACRRVLKDTGTIWVIGSYHNIYRVGAILMDLGFWILNDVVWAKTNPLPNLKGTRFTNAHETLLWAQKHRDARYTFHYQAMKSANEDVQMRSVWEIPICNGAERLTVNGRKAHTTQKPEALLARVLLSSTNPGDIVLDPFFGTGTTGAVAAKLRRRWIGIERDTDYVAIARQRLSAIAPSAEEPLYHPSNKPKLRRVPFIQLLEIGLLQPGQQLSFDKKNIRAIITADGALEYAQQRGSIHKIGTQISGAPCNGWEHWYFQDAAGAWQPIETLRQRVRGEY